MKKIFFILLLLIFTFGTLEVKAQEKLYKVVKIVDGDTIYIDFNNNSKPDKQERVRLNGIDTFETKLNSKAYYQMRDYKLTKNEVLAMGYLAKNFATDELLNKNVKVIYSAETKFDKHKRPLVSVYYDNKNYEKEILKQGLAVIYNKSNLSKELKPYENKKQLKKNIKMASELDMVYFNFKTGKYYEIDSKEVLNSNDFELMQRPCF